jgi:LysR family hydrogen peroxide-inducible transcriptional activator
MLDICTNMRKKNVKRQFQFESGSLETLKRLVDSYGGYTLLPSLASDALGSNVKLIPFDRPIPARQIGLVSRRNQYKVNLLDALEDALLKCVPDSMRNIKEKDLDVLPID